MTKTVYIVTFDWSTDEPLHMCDVTVFSNPEIACRAFDSIVTGELNPDLSWVGSEAVIDGVVQDGYAMCTETDKREHDVYKYWRVEDMNNHERYSEVVLRSQEICFED